MRGLLCHVNLIPLNPVAGSPYQPSTPEHAAEFQAILEQSGIPTTMRLRRGIDIDAGCGQLTSKNQPLVTPLEVFAFLIVPVYDYDQYGSRTARVRLLQCLNG